MYRRLLNHALIASLTYATTPFSYAGDVVVDNFTLGDLTDDTTLTLTDVGSGTADTFDIVETLGKRSGNNLFHSFLTFNIDPAEVALFSGDAAITNVISRVTGGSASLIDGTISNSITGAGFWFVNTSGVMIGPNAVFDVSGALSVGAVDYVELMDGQRFYALPAAGEDITTLSVNPVEFGFLPASTAGDLTITGFSLDDSAAGSAIGDIRLTGGNVSLTESSIINKPEASGSDISINAPGGVMLDSTVLGTNTTDNLNAGNILVSGGSVALNNGTSITSTASGIAGDTADPTPPDLVDPVGIPNLGSIGRSGNIAITGTTEVAANIDPATGLPDTTLASVAITTTANNVDSVGAGTVTIEAIAGDVFLANTSISSTTITNLAPADGGMTGGMSLMGSNDLTLDSVDLTTSTQGGPGSGDIAVTATAGSVWIRNGSFVTSTESASDAGNITISAGSVALNDGTSIASTASGADGSILDPAPPNVIDPVGVPNLGSIGRSGDISITGGTGVTSNLDSTTGLPDTTLAEVMITTAANNEDSVGVGNVTIEATSDNVTLANTTISSASITNLSPADGAQTGAISVTASNDLLLNDVNVITSTQGAPDAGSIDLVATNGEAMVQNGSFVSSNASGAATGASGSVTIGAATDATINTLAGSPSTVIESSTSGPGSAGNSGVAISGNDVQVTARNVVVDAPEAVNMTGAKITGAGNDSGAGSITFGGSSVSLNDGASLQVSSTDTATGNISITGIDSVTSNLDGMGTPDPSLDQVTVSSSAIAVDALGAGNVAIEATSGDVFLSNTLIESTTNSNVTVAAGGSTAEVSIAAGSGILTLDDVEVNAFTNSNADAGNVVLGTPDIGAVVINDSNINATTNQLTPDTVGNAGTITVRGDDVAISGVSTLTSAVTGRNMTGFAGPIDVSGRTSVTMVGDSPGSIRLDSSALYSFLAGGPGSISISAGEAGPGGTVGNIALTETLLFTFAQSTVELPATPGSIAVLATGDINLSDSTMTTTGQGSAGSGSITIRGLDGGAAASITFADVLLRADIAGLGDGGDIVVVASGDIRASDTNFYSQDRSAAIGAPGDVLIEGFNINLQNTSIETASSNADPGSIQLEAAGGSIDISGGRIRADLLGPGNGTGRGISLVASKNVSITDAEITSRYRRNFPAVAGDRAGDIVIDANAVSLDGARLEVSTDGDGDAGDITISAVDVALNDGASITASSTGGSGDAGSIAIFGSGSVTANVDTSQLAQLPTVVPLTDSSGVAFDTVTIASNSIGGTGAAGSVLITDSPILAADPSSVFNADPTTLLRSGQLALLNTRISTETASTNQISVSDANIVLAFGDQLVLENTAVAASTSGATAAGEVIVLSDSAITITGTQGTQGIEANSTATGNLSESAGRISILGDTLDLTDARISTTFAGGRATFGSGGIFLRSTAVDEGRIDITSSEVLATTSGAISAGDIFIEGKDINVSGGKIASSSSGDGRSGDIEINFRDHTQQRGSDPIRVSDSTLVISGGAQILAEATVAGSAGQIIAASDSISVDNATLSASAESGDARFVALLGETGINISNDSRLNASSAGAEGSGGSGPAGAGAIYVWNGFFTDGVGDIEIVDSNLSIEQAGDAASTFSFILLETPDSVLLTDTSVSATSSSTAGGKAGDIYVNSSKFEMSAGSLRSSSTGSGNAGNIQIAGSGSFLDGVLSSTGQVRLMNGADLEASASAANTTAGMIEINATGVVTIAGTGAPLTGEPLLDDLSIANINSSAAGGAAGNITITGSSIDLTNTLVATETGGIGGETERASISIGSAADTASVALTDSAAVASTSGSIFAGNIAIQGTAVTVDGALSALDSAGDPVGFGIESSTTGDGNAGGIAISGDNVAVNDGARIVATAISGSTGLAGSITISGTNSVTANSQFDPSTGVWEADPTLTEPGSRVLVASSADSLNSQGAGSVTIKAGVDDTVINPADVFLVNTQIESTTSSDIIPLLLGNISLEAIAGDLTIVDVGVAGSTTGKADAGDVTLASVTGDVRMLDSLVATTTIGGNASGAAGNIAITGNAVFIEGGGEKLISNRPAAALATLSDGRDADAGSVSIASANDLMITNTTIISSVFGGGQAGAIALTGEDIEIDSTTFDLRGQARFGGSTAAGSSISVAAVNNLTMTNSSEVIGSTTGEEPVPGAQIDVAAGNVLRVENSAVFNDVRKRASGGSIDLRAPTVQLVNAGFNSRTVGDGTGGSIEFAANTFDMSNSSLISSAEIIAGFDEDRIIGNAGSIAIGGLSASSPLQSVTISGGSIAATAGDIRITNRTFGDAGTIAILSDSALNLVETTISSSSFVGAGQAGTITIAGSDLTTSSVELSTETASSSITGTPASINLQLSGDVSLTDSELLASSSGATGAGSISIEGTSFSMNRGRIESSTTGEGNAGSISIAGPDSSATGAVWVVNGADIRATAGLEGATGGAFGSAGTIDILSDAAITLAGIGASDLVEISSSSFAGAGQAGTIRLTGSDLATVFAELSTETASVSTGVAAAIEIRLADDISLTDTQVLASTSGSTAAGDILVDGANINLLGTTLIGASSSGSGDAGNVDLNADDTIDMRPGAQLGARSTGAGNAGSVTMNAGNLIKLDNASVESSSPGDPGVEVGLAGSVRLAASELILTDSVISTQTTSNVTRVPAGVEPGSITIAGDLGLLLDGTLVQASTSGLAAAGNVSLSAEVIHLAADAAVLASTSGGGTAGNVELTAIDSINLPEGMLVAAQSTGPGAAGSVSLEAGNTMTITGATVESSSLGSQGVNVGVAGTITLDAGELILTNALISTETESDDISVAGGSEPGSITISSTAGLLLDGTLISASTSGLSSAGAVSLSAQTIDLANGAGVLASTTGGGNAGNVGLFAGDTITLPEGMLVAAQSTGSGNAGSVTLDAGGVISITGATVESSSLGQGVGLAGSVTVEGAGLELTDALISTRTDSSIAEDQIPPGFADEPGAITLLSDTGVMLDGSKVETVTSGAADAGDIYVEALDGDIDLANESAVTAATTGSGDAGDVTLIASGTINVPTMTEVSAKSTGPGDAGSVALEATGALTIDNAVVTSSSDGTGVGTAGNVDLSGSDITITSMALVSTQSSSDLLADDTPGSDTPDVPPGTITVTSPGLLLIEQTSLISASVSGAANGGAIFITANDLTMVEGSVIETRATGSGDSGSVTLDIANDVTLITPDEATLPDDQTAILTKSLASQGGTITADIGGVLFLDRSRVESSVETADGKGGDIVLTTNGLFMVGSQILARADEGNGGAIFINRGIRAPDPTTDTPFDGLFIVDSESLINADSAAGVSGEVNIDSPDADLTAVVEVVDARIVEDPTLADDVCNPSTREAQSSFIVEDQGGVAPSPDSYFSAGVLAADDNSQIAEGAVPTPDDSPLLLAAAGGCN